MMMIIIVHYENGGFEPYDAVVVDDNDVCPFRVAGDHG
jgi:hypothetical protein